MRIEGLAGPSVLADGAIAPPRLARTGEFIESQLHGRYFESGVRGNMYTASLQASTALTVGLSATAIGLILTNPAGSGFNLVLTDLTLALTTAGTTSAVVLAAVVNPVAAAVVQTTPVAVRKTLLGASGSGVGLAATAATLPAVPVVVRAIGGPVAAGMTTPPYIRDEIAGGLILAPGTAIATCSISAAISGIVSITWEEVPV